MHAPFVVILGILVGAEPDAGATRGAVNEILSEVWNASGAKAKKIGSSLLTKHRRKDADVATMQFAYGVALAKHHAWEAAETNFKAAAESYGNLPRVWLGLAHVHSQLGRYSQALEDLAKANKIEPIDDNAIGMTAGLVTFLSERPPAKFRAESAKIVEEELFPKLDEQGQARYKDARQEMLAYIASIPQIKEELQEPVKLMEEQASEAKSAADSRQVKYERLRQEYERTQLELNRVTASANVQVAEIDRLIARAVQRGDQVAAQSYQVQRLAILDRVDIQTRQIQLDLAHIDEDRVQLEREINDFLRLATERMEEAESTRQAIDKQLALPPPLWDPMLEKDRLLTAGGLVGEGVAATPAKEKKKREPRSAEDQARVLRSMADAFIAEERYSAARRYLERLVKEFPDSPWAEDAALELKSLPDGSEELKAKSTPKGKSKKKKTGQEAAP